MAARGESQGLQVALIIFVMITVALGVTTYIFHNSAVKLADAKKVAEDSARAQQASSEARDAQNKLLKSLIGYKVLSEAEQRPLMSELATKDAALKTEIDEIKRAWDEDMALFTGDVDALGGEGWTGPENWMSLPDYLIQVNQKRNLEWSAEKTRADTETSQKVAEKQAADAKVAAAEKGLEDAKTGYDASVAEYTEARSTWTGQTASLQDSVNAKNNEIKKVSDEASKQVKLLESEKNRSELLAQGLKSENTQLKRKDYDVPDGKISWVDQKSRLGYINLGLSDGLRRQQTFSVYDRDETNHSKAVPKAAIEVTRIVERHLAEVRILQDDLKNPILPGDLIFTPSWVPGRRVHFALAGFMDIDGDKKSDRTLIRNLVRVNGGVIDAEATDEGELTGEGMTVHTRYLILGDKPTEKSDAKVLQAYGRIETDAQQKGVETVSYQTFLGWMGYKGEVRTTQIAGGAANEVGTGEFKPRTPARGATGGAY